MISASHHHQASKVSLSVFLQFLLAMLAVLAIGAFCFSAYMRFHYPFEMDLIEGGMFEQVRHVGGGSALYGKPSLDFIPFIYGPLFTYLAAASGSILGFSFENLRLISIAATLASCLAIATIIFRCTASRFLAFCGAALFLATYAAAGFSFDQGRVDSLFLALLLWGYFFLRFGSATTGTVCSALLFIGAFFTKQVALIPILCLLPIAKQRGNKVCLLFAGITFGGCVLGVLALNLLTDGWYCYYAFNLPAQHDIRIAFYEYFWLSDIALVLPFAAGLAFFMLARQIRTAKDEITVSNLCMLTGFLLLSWVSRLHSGGIENVLAPAYAAISICAVVSVRALKVEAWGYALLCAQFLTLIQPPVKAIPSREDADAGRLVVKVLEAYPGPVFVPYHPYLLTMAGKPAHAHHWALYDVMRGDPGGEGARLTAELDANLAEQKFLAVLNDDAWYKDSIEKYYKFHAGIFDNPHVFRPVFGETRARPEFLYEPNPTAHRLEK